ncbi:MAG: MFS transporter [Nanoarchaeota archaeon]|nr:MFS transporter [Nanoarchaeota archaeon]
MPFFNLQDKFRRVKNVMPFSLAFFVFYLGWGFVSPIYSIKLKEWAGSYSMFGLIIALWGIIRFIIDTPIGVVCDKYNKKKILEIALLLYVLVTFAYTLVTGISTIVPLRIAHAFVGSLLWVSTWAMIREVTPKGVEETNIGFFSSFISIASLIGPVLGGILITFYSWEAVFYLLATNCFIAFLIIHFSRIEGLEKRDGKILDLLKKSLHDFKSFGKKASTLVLVTIIFFSVSSFIGSFIPIFLQENGLSILDIGFIIGIGINVSFVIFPLPVGILADKYGRGKTLVAGLTISILGLLLLTTSSGFTPLFLSVFVIYTGFSFLSPTIDAVVDDMQLPGESGGFAGITETVKDFGMILGPLFGGMLITMFGKEFVITGCSAILFLVALSLLKDWKRETGLF